MHVQWNLSIVDTIGTQLAVLYREVSLIQKWFCTLFYVFGTADNALLREVSFIQYKHTYIHTYIHTHSHVESQSNVGYL